MHSRSAMSGISRTPLAALRGTDAKVKVIGDIAQQNPNAADFAADLEDSQ